MMYTKEGEFEVSLTGGSPWGFGIRSQSGNSVFNRAKVIVAEVVQGGKADNSGNIHVGDEILAVNGFEIDNDKQATQFVKDAQKELILRVKRGQDRRRMNIRLTADIPNYFAEALEKPFEKEVHTQHNTEMISNNKRSSKEFEIDIGYGYGIDTADTIINYPVPGSSHLTRLTRSATDLSQFDQGRDEFMKDNLSSSQTRKTYRNSGSIRENGVQRVRIHSSNVSSAVQPVQHKYSTTDSDKHPSYDASYNLNSEKVRPSTLPVFTSNVNKSDSNTLEDLNRTWPSLSISETVNDNPSSVSVSAAKSQFEQLSKASERSQDRKPLSPLAPKPPSRNSSFRATRLSSSSSVFSDSPESRVTSPTGSSRDAPSHVIVSARKSSSAEDLDRPLPPRRFSKSAVLDSFRGKKHGHSGKRGEQPVEGVFHHVRTQSLPHYKIASRQNSSVEAKDIVYEDRLYRSSSFSRAQVIDVAKVQTLRSEIHIPNSFGVTVNDEIKRDVSSSLYPSDVNYQRDSDKSEVIQAQRTGEISWENDRQDEMKTVSHDWNVKTQHNTAVNQDVLKPKPSVNSRIFTPKPEVQPKSILKREVLRPEAKKEKIKPVPVLKEDSFMTRLLQESQAQGGSTAAAIKEEINQLTGVTSMTDTTQPKLRSDMMSANYKTTTMTNVKYEESEPVVMDAVKSPPVIDITKESSLNDSRNKVDECFDQAMTSKHDLPIIADLSSETIDQSSDDNVFIETKVEHVTATVEEDQPFESNIDDEVDEVGKVYPLPSDTSIDAQLQSGEFSDMSCDNVENQLLTPNQTTRPEARYEHTLSPADIALKSVHSRENSASSLLEETLESAKTIASIYSVEGPSRSPEGDDSMSTASEMRRQSLAKRVKRRPKLDSSIFSPERDGNDSAVDADSNGGHNEVDNDSNNRRSAGSQSSGDGSRPHSALLSPKLEALEEQKEILISSMKKKIELLKEQESEINHEMKQNDELGRRVAIEVKAKTSGSENSKYELFVGELNNIIGLLLSLTQRMHRYEVMLQDVDLAEENGRGRRDALLKSIERVKQQYEEACRIKEINDKRGETVSKIVEECCSDEEFADFQHFVDMKTQLALTQAEIRDKIKLGEEKLQALNSANIDWTTLDLSIK